METEASHQDMTQEVTGTKHALLIGIGHYPKSEYVTEGCVNDILGIRTFLLEKKDFPAHQMHVLVSPEPGRALPSDMVDIIQPNAKNIRAVLANLVTEVTTGDEVVIYYSGLGMGLKSDDRFSKGFTVPALVPSDTMYGPWPRSFDVNSLMETIITADELAAAVHRMTSHATVTVIIDTCYNEQHTRSVSYPSRSIEVELPPQELRGWIMRSGIHSLDTGGSVGLSGRTGDIDYFSRDRFMWGRPDYSNISGWINDIGPDEKLVLLAACAHNDFAYEYQKYDPTHHTFTSYGAFTYYLLETLYEITPETMTDLRWTDVYARLLPKMRKAFSSQEPTLEGRGDLRVFGM